jgi:two-component system, OmpR family, response regulator
MFQARFMMSSSSALRVLLVEDSALIAGRLAELIHRLPEVDLIETVATEEDAISRVASDHPDALILDLHLRTGSGFGVLRALARRSGGQRPKVVILTNFSLPEYRREAELYGVAAFLDKSRDYFQLPTLLQDFARERAADSTH